MQEHEIEIGLTHYFILFKLKLMDFSCINQKHDTWRVSYENARYICV